MNEKRLGRIESEINRVLSDAIYNGIKDNRINPSITNITKVSVTNDLGICYVNIGIFGDEKTKEKIEIESEDSETKNEDVLIKKVLVELEKLNEKIDGINKLFKKNIQISETPDKYHEELQKYKNDIYFQLIKPLVIDLINMRESMRKDIKTFGGKSEEDKLLLFQSYVEEIEIILENNDIEIYATDKENNNSFDAKKQRIVKKIETPYEELHGKISNILSNGYMYKGRVIFPEKVEVNIYKKPEDMKGE